VLGFDARHTRAGYLPGGAMRGYQSTAHFLMYLEGRRHGTVREVSKRLSAGIYTVDVFRDLLGIPLYRLVEMYEAEQGALGRGHPARRPPA